MSAFVQLLPLDPGPSTFSPSLHRPPSHRDSGWKREDAHDDGDEKKVSSHAPGHSSRDSTEPRARRTRYLQYKAYVEMRRGQHKKPRSLGFDNCFSHLGRGSPFRLALGCSACLLYTKSYDVCWDSLDVSRISFCRVRALRPPLSSLPMTKRLSKGGKR